jgi:hypothetical protein
MGATLLLALLRGGPPTEPRVIQIVLDPIPPTGDRGGTILLLFLAIVAMLVLFGGR